MQSSAQGENIQSRNLSFSLLTGAVLLLQDHGCSGGLMDFAFSFIIRNGGLDTEKDYKYKAQDGVCNVNKEKKHVVTIDSYEDVPPNDEGALKKASHP